jgi:hypothetical protein
MLRPATAKEATNGKGSEKGRKETGREALCREEGSDPHRSGPANERCEIDQVLKKAGTDKTRIITANIWLSDISTFGEMNAVWDAWVVPGRTPARATVESKLAAPEYKVEIMVTAAL